MDLGNEYGRRDRESAARTCNPEGVAYDARRELIIEAKKKDEEIDSAMITEISMLGGRPNIAKLVEAARKYGGFYRSKKMWFPLRAETGSTTRFHTLAVSLSRSDERLLIEALQS